MFLKDKVMNNIKHCIRCKRTLSINRFYRNHTFFSVCNNCEYDFERIKSDNIKSAFDIFNKLGEEREKYNWVFSDK